MPIPKIIYQTWKTKDLPYETQRVRDKIQEKNSDYKMILYDDADMENFIRDNFSSRILNAYNQLAVGAAKSDLWRYLIMYLNGGIYLDIDADITGNLDELIDPSDDCIITRENNLGFFTQWFLISQPNHPIFKYAIDLCIDNIEKRVTDNIIALTGTAVFSCAVNRFIFENFGISNPYFISDSKLNLQLSHNTLNRSCRIYKNDMGEYGNYKGSHADSLYSAVNHVYWIHEKKVFNDC